MREEIGMIARAIVMGMTLMILAMPNGISAAAHLEVTVSITPRLVEIGRFVDASGNRLLR